MCCSIVSLQTVVESGVAEQLHVTELILHDVSFVNVQLSVVCELICSWINESSLRGEGSHYLQFPFITIHLNYKLEPRLASKMLLEC